MAKQIIIGKEGTQPFALQDPKVSRRHAILNISDNGKLQLVDNQSTNGTFIYNGTQFIRINSNHPYPVSPDTMIQLGPDTRFHIKKLIPKVAPPETCDISPLRKISEAYHEKKMSIESKQGNINSLRSCTILVSLLAGGASGFVSKSLDLGENSGLYATLISVGIGVVLMVVLLMVINHYSRQLIKARTANEHDYAVKYVCPKCKVSFRGKIYENILSEGRCPRCKVKYVEKS